MTTLLSWYPGDHFVVLALKILLQVTVVIVVAMAFARPLRHKPAARYWALFAAFLCVLAGPPVTLLLDRAGLSLFDIPLPFSSTQEATHDSAITVTIIQTPEALLADGKAVRRVPFAMPMQPAPAAPAEKLRAAVAGFTLIWLCGTIVVALRIAASACKLRRLKRTLQPIDSEPVNQAMKDLGQMLGTESIPTIARSEYVTVPCAAGVLRPVIVLPDALEEMLTPTQLRAVLIHEAAHILRRDPLVVVLQRVAAALLWPHPLLHLLNRRLARARRRLRQLRALLHRRSRLRPYVAPTERRCFTGTSQSGARRAFTIRLPPRRTRFRNP